jgi:cytohesin
MPEIKLSGMLYIWQNIKANVVQMLLKHNGDVNPKDNFGKTPLHILSESDINDEDSHALLLLKHGAEVNTRDKDNETPLHLAMRREHFKLAGILLEHGAGANAKNKNGKIPLHILSENRINDEDSHALLLLKHGAEVNTRDKDNETPLHLATRWVRSELAGTLLEHGADANAKNKNGKTPLHILSESQINDKDSHALLLLKHGAEVNTRDKDNETPLHLAMRQEHFKLAGILLEHGADADAENINGKTPLHILSESQINDEDSVLSHALLLLKHGAEVNMRDEDNETSLHLAIRRECFKLAGILLERGADADAENINGKTPLCILPESRLYDDGDFINHTRLLFLEHVVGVNRRDENQITSLLPGIGRENYEFTRVIIELGADLGEATMEDNMGETSAQQVSRGQYNSRERGVVAQQSLERGVQVDLNAQNENQIASTYLQSNLGPFQIPTLLLYHSADLTAGKNEGETPLYQDIEGEFYFKGDCVGNTQRLTRA